MGVNKAWAVLFVIITTLLTTVAQLLLKKGLERFPEIFTNLPLIAGIILYGVGSIFIVLAFKGGDVSVLYPIIATGYLWVALLSFFVLDEQVNLLRWSGVIVIVIGVSLIGIGSRQHKGVEHGQVI